MDAELRSELLCGRRCALMRRAQTAGIETAGTPYHQMPWLANVRKAKAHRKHAGNDLFPQARWPCCRCPTGPASYKIVWAGARRSDRLRALDSDGFRRRQVAAAKRRGPRVLRTEHAVRVFRSSLQ